MRDQYRPHNTSRDAPSEDPTGVDRYTNYGREDQQRQSLTFQLKTTQYVYEIGEIEW